MPRRKTPTAILKARGSWRANTRPDEPQIEKPKRMISPPKWLSKEAKIEWKRVGPALHKLGLLTAVDRTMFAGCCEAWADYRRAADHVALEGEVLNAGEAGIERVNPWVSLKRQAWDRFSKSAKAFGLTPSGRAGLSLEIPKPAKPDGKARFFKNSA